MTTPLPKVTVVNVNGPEAGVAIACDSGAAWITQCCDSMDYVKQLETLVRVDVAMGSPGA